MSDMKNARRVMVDNQIRTFDVTDGDVLAAFDRVPREAFVDARNQPFAYLDKRIDLSGASEHRALLPPLILARLIQALAPRAGERALDVMGGYGYSATILAAMGLQVTALERDAGLSAAAAPALKNHAPTVAIAAVQEGLGAHALVDVAAHPFDVILVNGASEVEPSALLLRLAEGGRLGIILRRDGASQAVIYTKNNHVVGARPVFDAAAPVLPGFARAPAFAF